LLDGYVDNLRELVPKHAGGPPEAELSALFRREGTDVLARLRGAWSLLYWDSAAARGFLARDHLNQRPLFLYEDGPVLFFGSEIAPTIAPLARRPAPDAVSIAHLLAIKSLHENRTLYEGVHRLAGGHALELDGDRWTVQRFW